MDDRGWDLANTLKDNDASATKARGALTAWSRMLTEIEIGRIDIVVSLDMDRLLRTIRDLISLPAIGVQVLNLDGQIDLTPADGQFRATILTSIAEFEGRRKSERQRRAN